MSLYRTLAYLQVLPVQISKVLVGGLVATVTVRNDGVKQLLEGFIGLLVASHTANSHDEGMALCWKQRVVLYISLLVLS